MKRLKFGEGLLVDALFGNKKITLRKYREGSHNFTKDEFVVGEFADGPNIVLQITADTEIKTFNDLTDKEAQEDLFKDAEDAFHGLKHWYPDLKKTDCLAIIRFEIPKIEGMPTVFLPQ